MSRFRSFTIKSSTSTTEPSVEELYTKVKSMSNIMDSIKEIKDEKNYLIWRTLDGVGNNFSNPLWGKTNIPLLRLSPSDYGDGKSTLSVRGPLNPNPRVISNSLCKQTKVEGNSDGLTDIVWGWGQFLSHELAITGNRDVFANITTPSDDEFPNRTITFKRSAVIGNDEPIQQPNGLSAYIDGSNVYGTNSDRLNYLRLNDGTGKLKSTLSSNGEVLLPLNLDSLPNASSTKVPTTLFIAGDVRSNENVLLTSMHTLFLREHNRLCDVIVEDKPDWKGKGELIFQHAKRLVTAMMQRITYNEFLPTLMGTEFPSYNGYDSNINPAITTEFATVGFRLGHTLVTSESQIGTNPSEVLLLKDTFFNPDFIKSNGIDGLMLGSILKHSNEIDTQVVDALRNFLFGPPTATNLLDLASLNIQRGRDRGVPDYNTVRTSLGLLPVINFSQISSSKDIQDKLNTLYSSVDYIDPWIGMLAEDHLEGKPIGPLLNAILLRQFSNIRDGDRFWYEINPAISIVEKNIIDNTRLSDIIIRNTSITSSQIQQNVFRK